MSVGNVSLIFGIYKKIHSILGAILMVALGSFMLMVLVPIHLKTNGWSTSVIGWVMAGYSLGMIIGSRYGSKIISRVGHNRSYAAVAAVISVSASLHMFVDFPVLTFLLRVLVGISMAMIYVTLESWLGSASDSSTRGIYYGFYQLFLGIGGLAAPFLVAIYGAVDTRSLGLVTLCVSISLIPLMLTRFPSPELPQTVERISIAELLRDTPSGVVTIFVVGLVLSALLSLTALLGFWMYLDDVQIAILVASATASSIIFQIPVGWLAGKMDERKLMLILLIISLVAAVTCFIALHLKMHWYWVASSIFLLGGGFFCLYPVAIKFIFNQMDADKTLPAMGSLLIVNGLGMILGPITASAMMDWYNPSALFIYFIIVIGLMVPFMMYRIVVSRDPTDDEENLPYVITMEMLSPTLPALDPRSDYLLTKVSNSNLKALANSIAISPTKTQTLIQGNLEFLDGFSQTEILESLVLLKPRLSRIIIRAMLNIYPDSNISFTETLKDLITLNKKNINRLLYKGLIHQADNDTIKQIDNLFEQFITPPTEATEEDNKENEK